MTMLRNVFAPRQFTGWHMIGVMVAFFGTIIAVNLTMAWYANSSWTGLVVKNSYVASQHFNENTAALKAQEALGWKADQAYRDGMLIVALKDAGDKAIGDAIITAKIGRTSHEDEDRQLQLVETSSGTYSTPVDLASGLWQVDLAATGPRGETWTRSIRFVAE